MTWLYPEDLALPADSDPRLAPVMTLCAPAPRSAVELRARALDPRTPYADGLAMARCVDRRARRGARHLATLPMAVRS